MEESQSTLCTIVPMWHEPDNGSSLRSHLALTLFGCASMTTLHTRSERVRTTKEYKGRYPNIIPHSYHEHEHSRVGLNVFI